MLNTTNKAADLAAQMERQVKRREELRSPEEMPPVFAEMRIPQGENRDALQALMRNALSSPGETPAAPRANVQIVGVAGGLERDGCDFVKMAYLFLSILECPPDARDFVLAVCALSGGESGEFKVMTDAQIAELIGYDRKYIKQKRDALIQWQWKTDLAIIDVKENERDPATRHYMPTEYRARVVPIIAQFIRRARAVRTRNQDYAQKQTIEKGYREIVAELSDELPTAPVIQRREAKTFARPKDSQMTLLNGEVDQWKRRTKSIIFRVRDARHNPLEFWDEIDAEMREFIRTMKA